MSIRRSIVLLVLGASIATAVAAPSALADTAVPGSKYTVVFNGTGSDNVSWQDNNGDSGQQAGTWTIADDNNGTGVWIPANQNPAEEGISQSFPASHNIGSSGLPSTPGSISESGSFGSSYTCSATGVYDVGAGTLTSAVMLGHAVLATQYANNNRIFTAGHPDPNQPNGVALDGALFCQDGQGSGYGEDPSGFRFPMPTAGDQIAYSASVPFSSVGQAKIIVPASDQSHITTSLDCDPSDTMDWPSCTIHFSIQGSYTLTKVCDGVIDYTGSGLTGTCGQSPPSGSVNGAHSARASNNGTVTVGTASCGGPGSCTDTTTVTSSGSGTHSTKKVVYGHSKVTVAAGKTAKLKVKLTKSALKLLKKKGKLRTTVTVVITSSGGQKVTKTFKLTIKAPK